MPLDPVPGAVAVLFTLICSLLSKETSSIHSGLHGSWAWRAHQEFTRTPPISIRQGITHYVHGSRQGLDSVKDSCISRTSGRLRFPSESPVYSWVAVGPIYMCVQHVFTQRVISLTHKHAHTVRVCVRMDVHAGVPETDAAASDSARRWESCGSVWNAGAHNGGRQLDPLAAGGEGWRARIARAGQFR